MSSIHPNGAPSALRPIQYFQPDRQKSGALSIVFAIV